MSRPRRIEFSGSVHHAMARGNAKQSIFLDDRDRIRFLALLHNAVIKHQWVCHAYCLMPNHYHLMIELKQPSLSAGMQYLNAAYAQYFNQRHGRVGHVFQGRFKSLLIEKDSYLLQLSRYIVLNPVRARMVELPSQFDWSSYRATAGMGEPHPCLTRDWLLATFAKNRSLAQQRYASFVSAGISVPCPWQQVRHAYFLGSDAFISKHLDKGST